MGKQGVLSTKRAREALCMSLRVLGYDDLLYHAMGVGFRSRVVRRYNGGPHDDGRRSEFCAETERDSTMYYGFFTSPPFL